MNARIWVEIATLRQWCNLVLQKDGGTMRWWVDRRLAEIHTAADIHVKRFKSQGTTWDEWDDLIFHGQ